MRPHYLPTAHKQASETTLLANSPRSLLLHGFSPLALANACVHRHSTRTEPVCPQSPSVGDCPKKDGSSSQTETPGGLVMQEIASYDCPSKRLQWDSRSCGPLPLVSPVCMECGSWLLFVDIFAPIVGPFGCNVVPQHFLFALIVG
jgi:hypothetical protein